MARTEYSSLSLSRRSIHASVAGDGDRTLVFLNGEHHIPEPSRAGAPRHTRARPRRRGLTRGPTHAADRAAAPAPVGGLEW